MFDADFDEFLYFTKLALQSIFIKFCEDFRKINSKTLD